MRSIFGLCVLALHFVQTVQALYTSHFGARKDSGSRGMLRVTKQSPWARAPSGDLSKHSVFFKARLPETRADEDVATCGLEIIKCGADGLMNSDRDSRLRAVLSGTLFVSPQHRRKGIAQRMLREAEGQARWLGVDEMILIVKHKNDAAQRLYEKMGYKREPRVKEHGPEVCMRKHLYLGRGALHSMLPQVTFVEQSRR